MSNRLPLGDGLFAAALAVLLAGTAAKCNGRKDAPPPSFVLALLGAAAGMLAAGVSAFRDPSGTLLGFPFSRLVLYQGLFLLPMLGVGAFLLPRILGLPSRASLSDKGTGIFGWWLRALPAFGCGGVIFGGFWLEASGHAGMGAGLRCLASAAWFTWVLPGLWWRRFSGTQAWAARVGIFFILGGLAVMALFPAPPYGLEHLMLVSGFGVLILTMGARIVDGHSGHREQARGKSTPLRWIVWLAILAATTRASADFFPKITFSHYIYAAFTWIAISVIWLAAHRRKLATPDPEAEDPE